MTITFSIPDIDVYHLNRAIADGLEYHLMESEESLDAKGKERHNTSVRILLAIKDGMRRSVDGEKNDDHSRAA